MDHPLFSYIKHTETEYYTKILEEKGGKEEMSITKAQELYNKLHYKFPINITLFSFVIENIVKVNRSLRQPWPGTLLLAQEGCGADKITKLAILITNFATAEFEKVLRNY
jgi:hypothetical protein